MRPWSPAPPVSTPMAMSGDWGSMAEMTEQVWWAAGARLPIVILASTHRSGDFERCRRLGGALCVSKPVTRPSLQGAIVELLAESADTERRTVGSGDPALPHYVSGSTG